MDECLTALLQRQYVDKVLGFASSAPTYDIANDDPITLK